jgi:hypothetical protein
VAWCLKAFDGERAAMIMRTPSPAYSGAPLSLNVTLGCVIHATETPLHCYKDRQFGTPPVCTGRKALVAVKKKQWRTR